MDNIDLDLLKHCTERANYMELEGAITPNLCVKESWQLFQDFGFFFKEYPKQEQITQDFKLWARVTGHPNWNADQHASYGLLVDNVLNRDTPKRDIFMENIFGLKSQIFFSELAMAIREGKTSPKEAEVKALAYFRQGAPASDLVQPSRIDLLALAAEQKKNGMLWRLEDLNRSIGPLRKGDFVVIGKRPEVGGTSLTLSEMTHMFEQMDGDAVFFNNEEEEAKVYRRIVHAALGISQRQLDADMAHYVAEFDKWKGGRKFDLIHDTNITIAKIRRTLEERKYSLIGINVLIKVGGTGKKEDHDKFEALGQEFRKIAQEYGPVLVVAQASPEATNMKYIPQDHIYKSKTAIQGEADALIMLGKCEDDPENIRHIHVAKNKMPPADCTKDELRHIRSQVLFDMETSRFKSQSFTIHSRGK
jgi:hypothetical protein